MRNCLIYIAHVVQTSQRWKDSMVETAENLFTGVCSALGLGQ